GMLDTAATGRADSIEELLRLLAPVRTLRLRVRREGVEVPPDRTRRGGKPGRSSRATTLPPATPRREHQEVAPLEVHTVAQAHDQGELTASIFDAYAPHVHVPGAEPHPTKLVESSAMAAARPPQCSYRP